MDPSSWKDAYTLTSRDEMWVAEQTGYQRGFGLGLCAGTIGSFVLLTLLLNP